MVRSFLVGLFLLLAPVARGTAQSSADSAADTAADTAGALATVRVFIRANEVSDLDGIVGTFAEGATVFMPVGDAPYRLTGRSEIRRAFADIFKGRTGPLTITPKTVTTELFGDMAIVTAHLRDVPPLPITAPLSFSRRTFVLRRDGTQWLIVHHHASNFAWNPPGS